MKYTNIVDCKIKNQKDHDLNQINFAKNKIIYPSGQKM